MLRWQGERSRASRFMLWMRVVALQISEARVPTPAVRASLDKKRISEGPDHHKRARENLTGELGSIKLYT